MSVEVGHKREADAAWASNGAPTQSSGSLGISAHLSRGRGGLFRWVSTGLRPCSPASDISHVRQGQSKSFCERERDDGGSRDLEGAM